MKPKLPTPCAGYGRVGRRLALLVVVVFLPLIGLGCAPPDDRGGSGPGHRPQSLAYSPDQEYELGAKAYRQILEEARAKNALLPEDSRSVELVTSVGMNIVNKAVRNEMLMREINLHLKNYRFKWEFNVIESKQINAFCLPGGKVAVYSALIRIVENRDQLATVLSHEIAHALAHHSNERLTRESSGGVGWLYNMAFDRQQESEADHIGLFLMTFAGYDPDEALVFWQRMQQYSRGGQMPEILSNHPSDQRRIQQIRMWLPQVKAAKQAYDQGRTVSH